MRPVINSIKHFVQTSATGVASGGIAGTTICTAVAKGAARAATSDIEEGAIIKAVYIEYWITADNPNFTFTSVILKLPNGNDLPTASNLNNLQAYGNKKNVFSTHQGLMPAGDQTLAMYREWIKIPKGKQRFGLGDELRLRLTMTGSAGDFCGIAIYKEYE